jgi:exonuclease III
VTTFITWNANRGLQDKAGSIERLVDALETPQFIALQETGDQSQAASSLRAVAQLRGYEIVHRPRKDDPTYGGAALLVHQSIRAAPFVWPKAEELSELCEYAAVRVAINEATTIIVASLYIRGSSKDLDQFAELLQHVPDDMILLGDLNAEPGHSTEIGAGEKAATRETRGAVLNRWIIERGAILPFPDAPTRPATRVVDGRKEFIEDEGTYIDHIIIGPEAAKSLVSFNDAAHTLTDTWGSDHMPVTWSAVMAGNDDEPATFFDRRRVCWPRVTSRHTQQFNAAFRSIISEHRERRLALGAEHIESALIAASRKTLPHVKPRTGRDGLYWTQLAKEKVEKAVDKHGEASTKEVAAALRDARRKTLIENANLSGDPSSAWTFLRRYFSFNRTIVSKPPLSMLNGQPLSGGQQALGEQDRADTLAEHYAKVQGNPQGVDAQADLAKLLDGMPPPPPFGTGSRVPLSLTELRVYVTNFKTGRCADPLGLQAEHLRLLDDASLTEMLPFIDRCLATSKLPDHWRVSAVTSVPKRGRDLRDLKCWRPVSVTPIMCRLCETAIYYRVSHYLEKDEPRRAKSQFGFRRGMWTSMSLEGLSMFIKDGLEQTTTVPLWSAKKEAEQQQFKMNGEHRGHAKTRSHCTLLVSIDGSDAFCRALPARIVERLLALGLHDEARWIGELLRNRKLFVKEGSLRSQLRELLRGVPQGSVLGPLLWTIIIDELITRCERVSRFPIPGCIISDIFFADDINFAIRGFNPSSMTVQANIMLEAVRGWAEENGVPMGKLQATWIVGSAGAGQWIDKWIAEKHEIVYDETLRCVPGKTPLKLLGMTYDWTFSFATHAESVLTACYAHMRWLAALRGVLSAEKLVLLYRGIILSRLLYAIGAWYPYLSQTQRDKFEQLHYQACCIIVDAPNLNMHRDSVVFEATFRRFHEIACDEIIATADKLRRVSTGDSLPDDAAQCFGAEWVSRLFCDAPMPTAAPRTAITTALNERRTGTAAAIFPLRTRVANEGVGGDALRDIGRTLTVGDPRTSWLDTRSHSTTLRPLPTPHRFPAQDLAIFDTHVRFIVDAPGGLTKPQLPQGVEMSAKEKRPFAAANRRRMEQLLAQHGEDAIYVFTDASRNEKFSTKEPERCAGAFIICRGPDPDAPGAVIAKQHVPASPIACTYTGELLAIHEALAWLLRNAATVFPAGCANRTAVVVTDSKSALDSLRTTWLRRIGRLEQDVSRQLFDLATHHDIKTTMAFVFSHVGGAPGNDAADAEAEKARLAVGESWLGTTLWHVDTTRRVRNIRHATTDRDIATLNFNKFRFREWPKTMLPGPSEMLPRGMPRTSESLLYRARLGVLVPAGGIFHAKPESCPLCDAPGACARGGATVRHLAACRELAPFDLQELWTGPLEAAEWIRHANSAVLASPEGKARREAYMQSMRARKGATTGARRVGIGRQQQQQQLQQQRQEQH